MKKLKKYLKLISLLLALVVLLQGCTVYKSTSITLSDAAQNESKVKLEPKNGKIIKFKKIIFEDGVYYGIEEKNGSTFKISLNENDISSIREKNKVASTFLTVGVISVIIVALFIYPYQFYY